MKRTNFPRQFDKPDLNFQKVYTHSQTSGHTGIRIQSEIIIDIKTALTFIFELSKKPDKYQNDTIVAFNISRHVCKCIFVNLRTQKLQQNYQGFGCLNGLEPSH